MRHLVPTVAALVLLLAAAPVGAVPSSVGVDTVVVVVSARSTITEISRLHLVDLYMGRTTRFPDGEAAVPIDQRSGSRSRATFLDEYLDRSESQLKSHWSRLIFTGRGRPPREVASDEAVRDLVARDPRAIGYIDPRLLDASLRPVRIR